MVAQWLNSKALDLRSLGHGFDSNRGQLHSNLCASVTKQYNVVLVKGRWCSSAGKVTASLAESNGSLPLGDDVETHLRAQYSGTSMGELYILHVVIKTAGKCRSKIGEHFTGTYQKSSTETKHSAGGLISNNEWKCLSEIFHTTYTPQVDSEKQVQFYCGVGGQLPPKHGLAPRVT